MARSTPSVRSLGLAVLVGATLVAAPALAQTPPLAPVISEPAFDGQIVNPADVHMETHPFQDPDPGASHFCSDFEIWTVTPDERVWVTSCITGVERVHTHLGDGMFENTHADLSELLYDTDYVLRVRFQDETGLWSAWSSRAFTTGAPTSVYPLEIYDVAPTPTPALVDGTGSPLPVPSGAAVRLDTGAGSLLLRLEGTGTATPNVIDEDPLAAHAELRVALEGGSGGWLLPEADLLFTDSNGIDRRVVLPAAALAAGETRLFWISETGASYLADASPTVPDFSELARGAAVPWTVAQPGYVVEIVAQGFQLPVNVAFVPDPGSAADAPYFYVSELYGNIKVVHRDFSVSDYATGLLNYDPTGNFPGSGEQGLAGLVVDPATGDLLVGLLYDAAPPNGPHYPRVIRLSSSDGGRTASAQTVLLDMVGETQGQSHFISTLSLGPDGKLYVHMGDGFDASTALNLDSFRGKVLRSNLDGSAPVDNPFYDTGDGMGPADYVYAYGFRNPFGGAWRESDGELYEVENGPNLNDRLARVLVGGNYGWDGSAASMTTAAVYNWSPPHAPVNIAFTQPNTAGGSGFPLGKMDRAFVTESGPTWATGPQARGKRIVEFELDAQGELVNGPLPFVEYAGAGKATAVGLTAGPDGLYFTDLYKDQDYATPIDPGANVLRVRYVGTADFVVSEQGGGAPHTVRFTDLSDVPGAHAWHWNFGDGTTSDARNPWHTYSSEGVYDVRLEVSGSGGLVVTQKNGLVMVGDVGSGLRAEYFDDSVLAVPVLTRIDPGIDFEWGSGSPDPTIGADTFSARWTGELVPLFDGPTTFTTRTDDGVRLWVDGQLLVDQWVAQAPTEHSGTLSLVAGEPVSLRMEYFENGGGATAQLFWEHASLPREIVPAAQLSAFPNDPPTATPSAPRATQLWPNHPNPFNPSTVLRFSLATAGPTELALYDAAGRRVRALVSGPLGAGSHEVIWNGKDDAGHGVASGVYFARLRAPGTQQVRKLVLVR